MGKERHKHNTEKREKNPWVARLKLQILVGFLSIFPCSIQWKEPLEAMTTRNAEHIHAHVGFQITFPTKKNEDPWQNSQFQVCGRKFQVKVRMEHFVMPESK